MLDFDKLTTYKEYLNSLQKVLDSYFDNQKEYLYCKAGCSHCCEKGTYPYSKIEVEYLMLGVLKLPIDEQKKIENKIYKLKEKYEKYDDKRKFMHRCPFLNDNNMCSVYDYRGLICRAFGILQISPEGKVTMPFCHDLGLNYSKVYDDKKNKFDLELVEKLGYKNYPRPFAITLKSLMDEDTIKDSKVDFGEIKALIEWFC